MSRKLKTPLQMAMLTAALAAAPVLAGEPAAAPAAHVEITLPTAAGAGAPKEVSPVLDTAELKLATIILRKGTVLAEHSSPMPVTIMALKGAGTATVNGKKIRLDAGHMVYCAPNAPHAVEPDAGTDLILLVHHVKVPGAATGGPHGHGKP